MFETWVEARLGRDEERARRPASARPSCGTSPTRPGSWLAGGTSIAYLGDPARPREVASYPGDAWASYLYNGRVYSSDAERGLRVFKFSYQSGERLDYLNPQTQMRVID